MSKGKDKEVRVLASYFRTGVRRGYPISELKSNAIKKGYTKTSINEVISKIGGKQDSRKSKIEKSKKIKSSKNKTKSAASFSAFSEAIHDLDVELKALAKQKENMRRDLSETSSEVDRDRTKEKELQERIARLVEQEAHLSERKKKLQTSLDMVSDKMNKISKIKSEMTELS